MMWTTAMFLHFHISFSSFCLYLSKKSYNIHLSLAVFCLSLNHITKSSRVWLLLSCSCNHGNASCFFVAAPVPFVLSFRQNQSFGGNTLLPSPNRHGWTWFWSLGGNSHLVCITFFFGKVKVHTSLSFQAFMLVYSHQSKIVFASSLSLSLSFLHC